MFSPSSPNPAPHKSAKPNAPFIANSSANNNNNNNTLNESNLQSLSQSMYPQFSSNSHGDIDEMESENCPATRIPEWCQDIRVSTPLSADEASGVSSSNYSDDNSPFEQEEKE
jgi:hypothetical protein